MEILRAVGMEMFALSGIKSNQLDEILSPSTKRASKYHSLNTLIRLGYIEPHVKGDPYKITEAGRLKLSNAEGSIVAAKSKESKASPSPFIWNLPDPGLMSSPIPHLIKGGMDQTSDQTDTKQAADVEASEKPTFNYAANVESSTAGETLGNGPSLAARRHKLSAEAPAVPALLSEA